MRSCRLIEEGYDLFIVMATQQQLELLIAFGNEKMCFVDGTHSLGLEGVQVWLNKFHNQNIQTEIIYLFVAGHVVCGN